MPDERTPLLQFPGMFGPIAPSLGTHHEQFCHLMGVRPLHLPPDQKHTPHPDSLYVRALRHRRNQNRTYLFTATLTNTLLLSQVVLGAALTALAASNSNRILITVFGALNTVIAGLVAFLKSRGQPVRARMFRDDLDRVVDEVENSAVMWLGISSGAHGYDAIDIEDQVTVRSEVARLTRLYDRAVKTNTMNDPDMYAAGAPGDPGSAGLRARPGTQSGQPAAGGGAPAVAPASSVPTVQAPAPPVPAVQAPIVDPDESPATKAPELPKPKEPEVPKEEPKPTPAPSEIAKPDTSTATVAKPATQDTASSPTSGEPIDSARRSQRTEASSAHAATPTEAQQSADNTETLRASDDGKKHSPEDAAEGNSTG